MIDSKIYGLLEKIDSNKEQFIKNFLSLHVKAFIKCEYIRFGKPYCEYGHGSYYYDETTEKIFRKIMDIN